MSAASKTKTKVKKEAAGKPRERCEWVNPAKDDYVKYHDEEWGVPVHDDRLLFEMLILEGAQAGLSWETILLKRDGYRKAFANFEIAKVAKHINEVASSSSSSSSVFIHHHHSSSPSSSSSPPPPPCTGGITKQESRKNIGIGKNVPR